MPSPFSLSGYNRPFHASLGLVIRRRMDCNAIATELLTALDEHRTVDAITARDPDFDATAAYVVGAEIFRRRCARGEKPVGRKIGFTNRGIWPEYGVAAPMWAHVYDSTVTYLDESSGRLPIGHLVQPLIEPEIVLHFSRAPGLCENENELLMNVDWVAHGFEIVQCHFPDWKFALPDTIADFGLHGALVIGPRQSLADLSDVAGKLRTFTITLAKDGMVRAQGAGANVLGSPILAALHLLNVLKDQPQFEPIQAGEIVTTGTLLSPPAILAGETWITELAGIELPGLQLSAA
jgi:2-keto-4-pentenoate hydratase